MTEARVDKTEDPIAKALARTPVLLLDGGLATELEALGCDLHDPLWSARVLLHDRERIAEVHRRYLEAGADILTTASYQATFEGFMRRGLSHDEAAALLRESVALAWGVAGSFTARRGLNGRAIVAASIGSYGAFLADGSEYRGRYGLSLATLREWHRPRFEVLAGHADVLACETIPSRAEAEALAELIDASGVHAWISFSCADERNIAEGEPLAAAVAAVAAVPGVAAIGVNCVGPERVAALVEEIAAATEKPIVVYPNSGERWHGAWSGAAEGPAAFAAHAAEWYKRGARIVGGCCRTGPAHIAALARWRDGLVE